MGDGHQQPSKLSLLKVKAGGASLIILHKTFILLLSSPCLSQRKKPTILQPRGTPSCHLLLHFNGRKLCSGEIPAQATPSVMRAQFTLQRENRCCGPRKQNWGPIKSTGAHFPLPITGYLLGSQPPTPILQKKKLRLQEVR